MSSVPNDEKIDQAEEINREEHSQESNSVPTQTITDNDEYQDHDQVEQQPLTAERLDQNKWRKCKICGQIAVKTHHLI